MVIPARKPKVSQSEKKFRLELFPDIKEILNTNVTCTSCRASVKDLIIKGKFKVHTFLETPLCEKCYLFYGDGNFSVDEDGSDKYCRWCGQGGTLFLCSTCTSGFCKKCVKRNLPKSAQAKIEEDDWVCYCCDTEPLYELRAQGWAAQQYAIEYLKSKGSVQSKRGSSSKTSHKRSRDSESAESEGEVESKKQKLEPKKKNAKKHDNVEKEGRTGDEEGGGRQLRKRVPKESDAKISNIGNHVNEAESSFNALLPSGIKAGRIKVALKKFNDTVIEVASMTKETHKKLLQCKTRTFNIDYINSVDTVCDYQHKLCAMIMTLETGLNIMRSSLETFKDEWCRKVHEDMTKDKDEVMDVSENLENGLLSEEQKGEKDGEPEGKEEENFTEVSKELQNNDELAKEDKENKTPLKESVDKGGTKPSESDKSGDDKFVKSGDDKSVKSGDDKSVKSGDDKSGDNKSGDDKSVSISVDDISTSEAKDCPVAEETLIETSKTEENSTSVETSRTEENATSGETSILNKTSESEEVEDNTKKKEETKVNSTSETSSEVDKKISSAEKTSKSES